MVTALEEAGTGYGFRISERTGLFVGFLLAAIVVTLVSGGGEKIGKAAEELKENTGKLIEKASGAGTDSESGKEKTGKENCIFP